ncbi:MAG: 5-oxoprolinase subunit PxpA [Chitinophagaceae bacterium]
MNNINSYKHNLQVDLNCDMGEGMNNEAEIMPFISSANIACGFHAGNEYTIKKTIEIALEHGVAIGAHPGYDDPENFGRISQPISVLDLAELINEQIYTFENIATPMGAHIHHVKLHGALYNDCAKDPALSKIFVQTIQAIYPEAYIYGLSESNTIQQAIILGQPYMQEVFADRTYQKDGTLTPRHIQGALIEDIGVASQQALSLVMHKKVHTLQDEIIKLPVDTICIHGDGFHAVEMAKAIYTKLKEQNIEIKYPQ